MLKTRYFVINIFLILLYLAASVVMYPESMPTVFLISTALVTFSTLAGGKMVGVFAYVLTGLALLLIPGQLQANEFYSRFVVFSFTAFVLSSLALKIKSSEILANLQKNRLTVIADSLSEVLLTIDQDYKITFVNSSIKSVFGYTPEEVLNKNLVMLIPKEQKEAYLSNLKKIIGSSKEELDAKSLESIGFSKSGEKFPIEISFGELQSSKGRSFSCIIRDVSLRKSFQLKLNEISAIVDISEDAIISKDLNGKIKTWNKGAEQIFGWTEKEAIGQSIFILCPEEYVKEEETVFEILKKGDKVSNYETVRRRKDGELIYVSISVSPIRSANGEMIAVSKIARDITYRKQQETNAEKYSERYKAFIAGSDEAIWMVEYKPPISTYLPVKKQIQELKNNGFIVEVNDRMLELYDFKTEAEILNKSVTELPKAGTPEYGQQSDSILREFIANDYSVSNWESSYKDEKGNIRHGSTSCKGIIQDDKIIRAWVVQRDTTKKKAQEQQLEQSRERYRTFIQNSEDAIWRTEFTEPIPINLPVSEQVEKFFKNGYIAEANQSTARVLHAPNLHAILNKPLENIGGRTMSDDRFMEEFIRNGYTLNDYESSVMSDGKVTHTNSSVKGIIEDGIWVRAWVVRRDITPQKQHQIEKERMLAESEKIRGELEVASYEKDRFLANLSHELRTPLVAILGYSSILMDSRDVDEKTTKMIATINKNANLQVQLIEDLLDLSRIVSGKIELKREVIDVTQVVSDSVETLSHQAEIKGLEIIEDSKDCTFYGDKKRISQVVLNLLSNAVKFTEKGSVKIYAKCNEDTLVIRVVDTGIGIDAKNFNKLFHPFKQLDESSTRAKQGLGLGLSIVKTIVELHGGRVEVSSKLGEGSEFKAYLPIVDAHEEEKVEVVDEVVLPSFEGVDILLVEDDIDGAGFIKYLYEQNGAKVDWVTSARAGKEYSIKNKYSLYIFDLSMPDEDGLNLIKGIRASGDTTKAVALTAFADSYYESRSLESGFDMFLKKPASLSELLSVSRLLTDE